MLKSEKLLLFIPYQDSDNFLSDGILTREFAMLYMLWNKGYKKVINIKKPRTILDKKRYAIHDEYYPNGTIENVVKEILDESLTLQHLPLVSINQVLKKRAWWERGYLGISKKLMNEIKEYEDVLVYSNNPYAVLLLQELKENGCKIYFDIMDNFAIHPSLNEKERAYALSGYKKILEFADVVSANSVQTCEFMKKHTGKDIILVKNGVFLNNEMDAADDNEILETLRTVKPKYSRTVGYIGKLGKRLDEKLIKEISEACADTLFVFVGPYLTGQINEELIALFQGINNVLHLPGIPSAYVYTMLSQFDVLMIPHSVGKNENGGDPLKLYQYLTRKKPIISTAILGVDEFEDYISISNQTKEWIEFLRKPVVKREDIPMNISWDIRMTPVYNVLNLKEND